MTTMTTRLPQRAVMWDIPQDIAAWRRRTGADRNDEVWDGVIHMSPSPTGKHQGIGGALYAWLTLNWRERGRGVIYYERNVAPAGREDWMTNYRSPDLVLVKPERYARDVDTHFAGGPNVVVEIRSPGDVQRRQDCKGTTRKGIGVRSMAVAHYDARRMRLLNRVQPV